MTPTSSIRPLLLTHQAYEPYGEVVAVDDGMPFKSANMGTARRYNRLARVENRRSGSAELNLCQFQVSPVSGPSLSVELLEKHQYSTQVFLPLTPDACFLVIVCLGGDEPELETLRCFIERGQQGISYRPGVWHYPMTAIERPVNFLCLINEDDSPDDCQIVKLSVPIEIEF